MFDSHAHYDDTAFDNDRSELLEKVQSLGVQYIINAGTNIKSSKESIELSQKYGFIYSAIGVHPHDAEKAEKDYIDVLKEISKAEKCIAIGEIGLDYYYDYSPKDVQKKVFEEQIILAKEQNLPIIIHDRDAHEDTLEILKKQNVKNIGGVMHCFSGSYEMAKEIIKIGLYIGVGGSLTFSNAKKTVEVVEKIPIEYILSETDCPYLTPVPFRGKRNDSSYMKNTIEKIAQIKQIGFEEADNILTENAKRVFNIR
jgi:TatD DNase family protein